MSELKWSETGMRASIVFDIAVVRAHGRRKCATCGKRRVCFAMSATSSPLGNPETPWRCSHCWGLR